MEIYFDREFWDGATKPIREEMNNPFGLLAGGFMMLACCLVLAPACVKFKRTR